MVLHRFRTAEPQLRNAFLASLTLLKTKIWESTSKTAACPFSILYSFHNVAFCNVPAIWRIKTGHTCLNLGCKDIILFNISYYQKPKTLIVWVGKT